MPRSSPLNVGTAKTTRLRKLACHAGCGYIARVSRSAMDRGLPGCPCGGLLAPVELDDIERCVERDVLDAAVADQLDAVQDYLRQLHSVEAGQERAAGSGRRLGVDTSTWRAPHDIARERVHAAARAAAAGSRLAALRPIVDEEPIPF